MDAVKLGRAHSNFNTKKQDGTVGGCVGMCVPAYVADKLAYAQSHIQCWYVLDGQL